MKKRKVSLYVNNDRKKEIHYYYISTKRSKVLTKGMCSAELTHGKIIKACFKRRLIFNIFKNDFIYAYFILPLKSQWHEGTAFGTYGGKKEGIFIRRWWEIKEKSLNCHHIYHKILYYLKDNTASLSNLPIKRVRNKKLAKALEQTYNSIF